MSFGFWVRTFLTLATGALFVLGVAYEEKLIAFEQRLALRWREAWARNFGASASAVVPRPKNVQARAVSYRTCIASGKAPEYADKPVRTAPVRSLEVPDAVATPKKVASA
ncbi:MAG: hypothetical protein LBN05_07195 [Oscillospiraceae bacterium]|jgi:hypothetical protein|nr:hypothetical protein [Oscillospiraceae bacterium]